jgi:hypothetical protein
MDQENADLPWQVNLIKPRLPWNKQPVRPAEVGNLLCSVMVKRENLLEDANYNKVVPNQYLVELSRSNYQRNFQPLRESLIDQWREKLLESLVTANSRLGRKVYRFEGEVEIQIRPADDLDESQARILTLIQSKKGKNANPNSVGPRAEDHQAAAFVDMIGEDRQWPIYPGETTVGRSQACQIYLDLQLVQQKRLVSGQHAHFRCEEDGCFLFDGSLSGKPSANGTFVNLKRINELGKLLQDGDTIILAADQTGNPRVGTEGTVAFRFRTGKIS